MTARRIFKYELKLNTADHLARVAVDMPEGAKVIHVGSQGPGPNPILWALVDDPTWPIERRTLGVLGTGHPWPWPDDAPIRHIGTAVCSGGSLVWHVFEADGSGAWGE